MPIPSFVVVVVRHPRTRKFAAIFHDERCGWEFPAGGIEPGETALRSADRELREETGLEGFAYQELGLVRAPSGRWGVAVWAPRCSGRLRGSEEGRAEWVSGARLLGGDATFGAANREVLAMYLDEDRKRRQTR